jgi:hypothetical protein
MNWCARLVHAWYEESLKHIFTVHIRGICGTKLCAVMKCAERNSVPPLNRFNKIVHIHRKENIEKYLKFKYLGGSETKLDHISDV